MCAHAKTSAPASANHLSISSTSFAWSGRDPPGRWSDEKAQPFAQAASPVFCELFLPLSRLVSPTPSTRVSLSLRTAAPMAWRWCGAHPHAIAATGCVVAGRLSGTLPPAHLARGRRDERRAIEGSTLTPSTRVKFDFDTM